MLEALLFIGFVGLALLISIVISELRKQTSLTRRSLLILQALNVELSEDSSIELKEVDAELIEVGDSKQEADRNNLRTKMAQSNSIWEEDELAAEELEQL